MEEIVYRYLEDLATDAEKRELLEWLRNRENRRAFATQRSAWIQSIDKHSMPGGGTETWYGIQARLLEKSVKGWQKSRRLNRLLRYAAIFLLVSTFGTLFLWMTRRPQPLQETWTAILADNGQISRAELPDGSQVWINSDSRIGYDAGFGIRNREIRLSGEAYFEVVENSSLPLVVDCRELRVRVTGTRFNVNAFPGKPDISVVLEEGAVELLRGDNTSFSRALRPGEMASYHLSDRKMTVTKVNTRRITSWKEGIINMYDQTLEEVAERLKSRYNQEFVVLPEVKGFHYTFTIKNESLQEILALMEKITPVKAVQEGAVITLGPARKISGRSGK